MEKITEYKFHDEAGNYVQREVFLSGRKVLLYSDGKAPSAKEIEKLNSRPVSEAGYQAAWYRNELSKKPYDKLHHNNKVILDFLNARLTQN